MNKPDSTLRYFVCKRGGSKTKPIYHSWASMLSRCRSLSHKNYATYGGRGIKVCERWLSFENFLSDMGNPPAGHTLDRIDNNGNYEPSNCRWATRKEQAENRNATTWITINGDKMCLNDWSRWVGLYHGVIRHRKYKLGWSWPDAIFTPPWQNKLSDRGVTWDEGTTY